MIRIREMTIVAPIVAMNTQSQRSSRLGRIVAPPLLDGERQ